MAESAELVAEHEVAESSHFATNTGWSHKRLFVHEASTMFRNSAAVSRLTYI